MPSEKEFIRHEVKEVTFYVIWGILATIVLPLILGFGLGAFEESFVSGRALKFGDFLTTYMIYYIMIVGGLGLTIIKIREIFVTKRSEGIANMSKPDLFAVGILHDPEKDGALWQLFNYAGFKGKKNPMRWSLSILRMFIIGSLIFATIGLLQTISPSFQFVGIPQIPFQVTPITEVLFIVEPPSFAETTVMLFVLAILLGFVAYIVSVLKLPSAIFWIIAILIIPFVIGFLWMGFHSIVYGNSEAKLLATFIFGWVGSLITILLGSWIWWYLWHVYNNLFAKLSNVYPRNEDILFISALIIAGVIIVWIIGEILVHRYKRKDTYFPKT